MKNLIKHTLCGLIVLFVLNGCSNETVTNATTDNGFISATINGVVERSTDQIANTQSIFDTLRKSTDVVRHRDKNSLLHTWMISISYVDWRTVTLPYTISSTSTGKNAVIQFMTSTDDKDFAGKKSYIGMTSKPNDSLQITVTELTQNRIKGTFNVNLYRDSTKSIARVRDGVFDVPLVWGRN